MKDEFDNINKKLDIIDEKLGKVDVTLAVNTQSLIEHTRRTKNLEDRVEPIEKHVLMINAFAKICAGLVATAGFVLVVLEILGRLK